MVTLLIPIENDQSSNFFYIELLNFEHFDGSIYLPHTHRAVKIRYQIMNQSLIEEYPHLKDDTSRFPIFEYNVKKDFLRLIEKLHNCGVFIELVMCGRGGDFTAFIRDPSNNQIWLTGSESEDDYLVDRSNWSFYRDLN